MLSKTIRNAATSGKYNEFDLEAWAHEARRMEDENAELREEVEEWRVQGARSDDVVWDKTDRTVIESGERD